MDKSVTSDCEPVLFLPSGYRIEGAEFNVFRHFKYERQDQLFPKTFDEYLIERFGNEWPLILGAMDKICEICLEEYTWAEECNDYKVDFEGFTPSGEYIINFSVWTCAGQDDGGLGTRYLVKPPGDIIDEECSSFEYIHGRRSKFPNTYKKVA